MHHYFLSGWIHTLHQLLCTGFSKSNEGTVFYEDTLDLLVLPRGISFRKMVLCSIKYQWMVPRHTSSIQTPSDRSRADKAQPSAILTPYSTLINTDLQHHCYSPDSTFITGSIRLIRRTIPHKDILMFKLRGLQYFYTIASIRPFWHAALLT